MRIFFHRHLFWVSLFLSTTVFAQSNLVTLGNGGQLSQGTGASTTWETEGDSGLAPGGSITTGDENVCIGTIAGQALTTGHYNTFLGTAAGYSATTSSENTFIGFAAGSSTTSGSDNTFVGATAGANNTGTDNTFIGTEAGETNTTGIDNTFVGEEAGFSNTTGSDNTYIGEDSGLNGTTGNKNTAVGAGSLRTLTTGEGNTAVGFEAGYDVTEAVGNSSFGAYAGVDARLGMCNSFFGAHAGRHTEYGDFNTAVGVYAGWDNNRTNAATNEGNANTYLGFASGVTNRDGNNNTLIGAFADHSHIDEDQAETYCAAVSEFFPDAPVRTNGDTEVSNATALGASIRIVGNNSVAIGYDVNSSGVRAICVGPTAECSHTDSIVIGYGATSHGADTAVIGNDDTVSIDPNADGVTSLGSGTYRFADVYTKTSHINADAGAAASMTFSADGATDADDTWQLSAANGGEFSLSSFATGVFSTVFSASNTGNVTVSGDITMNSDERLKRNIKPIRDAQTWLNLLKPVTYQWKAYLNRNPSFQFGFIAQDVETVFPELVRTGRNGVLSVNYQGFIPLLVEAAQEADSIRSAQQAELEALRIKVEKQDRELEVLKRQMRQLLKRNR